MQIMDSRPNDVSAEVWLLALALSSLLPAAVYVGMTWRVLHKMKNGTRQSDQAVAVVAALCVKNAATIEKFMTLLDGLDTHPSIGKSCQPLQRFQGCQSGWACYTPIHWKVLPNSANQRTDFGVVSPHCLPRHTFQVYVVDRCMCVFPVVSFSVQQFLQSCDACPFNNPFPGVCLCLVQRVAFMPRFQQAFVFRSNQAAIIS